MGNERAARPDGQLVRRHHGGCRGVPRAPPAGLDRALTTQAGSRPDRKVIDVDLTPGMRLRCELCATEVVVIRAGSGAIAMTCGGAQLRADAVSSGSGHAGTAVEPARLGKRYTDPDSGVEILCVK